MEHVGCLICGASERVPVLRLPPDAHRRVNRHTAREPVRFFACKECGFIYQTPRLTLEELRPIYADEYRKNVVSEDGVPVEQYLRFARDKSREEFEWIAKRLVARGRPRVLEVGCATGQLLRYFKDAGWDALGLEPTRVFAEYGSRAHGLRIEPVLFEEAALEADFDLVVLSQVLEHLAAPAEMLRRAAALLRPGGRLYVSVPYYERYLPIRPARELFISTHLSAFSTVSLTNLAAQAGLATEDIEPLRRYLLAMLRPDATVPPTIVREDPRAVRARVRSLRRRYVLLHDSRYLLAEWAKRRIKALLGEGGGERAIGALCRLKHRVARRRRLPAVRPS